MAAPLDLPGLRRALVSCVLCRGFGRPVHGRGGRIMSSSLPRRAAQLSISAMLAFDGWAEARRWGVQPPATVAVASFAGEPPLVWD